MSAKWITFILDTFFIFHNQLADHICKCTNDYNIDEEIALEDNDDYDAFINESKKLKNSTKNMVPYVTLKSSNNPNIKKRKKKVK
ncbi:15315_t:CDS:2, partial [Racocetra fulgida]